VVSKLVYSSFDTLPAWPAKRSAFEVCVVVDVRNSSADVFNAAIAVTSDVPNTRNIRIRFASGMVVPLLLLVGLH